MWKKEEAEHEKETSQKQVSRYQKPIVEKLLKGGFDSLYQEEQVYIRDRIKGFFLKEMICHFCCGFMILVESEDLNYCMHCHK